MPNTNQQAIVVEAKEGRDQDTFLHFANEYSKINKKSGYGKIFMKLFWEKICFVQ